MLNTQLINVYIPGKKNNSLSKAKNVPFHSLVKKAIEKGHRL